MGFYAKKKSLMSIEEIYEVSDMANRDKSCFSFFRAAKGDWRNSIFIGCRQCQYGNVNTCQGYLLVPDYDGKPIILPFDAAYGMGAQTADKSECKVIIDRKDFETLYASWLLWNIQTPNECALAQVVSQTRKLIPSDSKYSARPDVS